MGVEASGEKNISDKEAKKGRLQMTDSGGTMGNTLLSELFWYCNSQYNRTGKCQNCANDCKGSCKKCLGFIFNNKYKDGRVYDCQNMINYYVCKFIYKYSMEIDCAIHNISSIIDLNKYNILSIGCGPATELCGFIRFISRRYPQKNITYAGVDSLEIWKPINEKLNYIVKNSELNAGLYFYYMDVFKFFELFDKWEPKWIPNILILQYVISAFAKYDRDNINNFFDNLINIIIQKMPLNSFIIINDLNTNTESRDIFKVLENKLSTVRIINSYEFSFFNPEIEHSYPYGKVYQNTSILNYMPEDIKKIKWKYDIKEYLTSAQLILHCKELL